jgi:hypothetical protein
VSDLLRTRSSLPELLGADPRCGEGNRRRLVLVLLRTPSLICTTYVSFISNEEGGKFFRCQSAQRSPAIYKALITRGGG